MALLQLSPMVEMATQDTQDPETKVNNPFKTTRGDSN